jgi:ribonucleotide reductase beta subunit family protein with ferritin-like domain
MSALLDLRKEVAFFERRPAEYQSGEALKWD